MSASTCQVAIIGAGPYGLAVAAHLRSANVETRVFGEAMGFWQQQMPIGMFLISSRDTSHIADPHRALTLNAYQATHDADIPSPVPIDNFVNYGLWFQRQAVPDLDRRRVERIERGPGGFRLTLEDGECLQSERVVLATGLAPFARVPAPFASLPRSLASHSSDHHDLSRFAGREVVVIGAGQSAMTSAALLHEAGAGVEVVVRSPQVHWAERKMYKRLGPFRRLAYAPTEVGPAGISWIVGLPGLFQQLPRDLQEKIGTRAIRPAGAGWLRPRVAGVPISAGRVAVSATPVGERLQITLNDRTERTVDHALLATGYQIDVDRYAFLAPELAGAVERINGHPRLGRGFESSVPGLHFVGAPAAASFGPVMRFVAGTGYTAEALTRRVRGKATAPVSTVSGVAQYS